MKSDNSKGLALHKEFIYDMAEGIERRGLEEVRINPFSKENETAILTIAAALVKNDIKYLRSDQRTCKKLIANESGVNLMARIDFVSIDRKIIAEISKILLNGELSYTNLTSSGNDGIADIRLWINCVLNFNKLYR